MAPKKKKIPRKKKKLTLEERKMQKRVAERLRYARLKSDPVTAETMRTKNLEKKKKRKEEGKDKSISAMTKREKRAERKRWRESSMKYRLKKKQEMLKKKLEMLMTKQEMQDLGAEQSAEPMSEAEPMMSVSHNLDVGGPSTLPEISNFHQLSSGEKTRRRNRKKLRIENNNLRCENANLKKKIDSTRKNFERYRQNSKKRTLTEFKSPNTKVINLLELNDQKEVRKKLLFGETLVQQLKDNWKATKSRSSKRGFSKAVIGGAKWLKKYGLLQSCNFIPSNILRGDVRRRHRLSCKNLRARKLTDLVRSEVRMFLEEEDHSRVCPGKKDCITRGKVKKQKRLLQADLKELHREFLKTRPYKISYASFCRLRPFWIVMPSVTERDTCQCIIHENFRLLLRGLSNAKAIANPDPSAIKRQLCCGTLTESCLFRTCKFCKSNTIWYETFDGAVDVDFHQWMTTKVEYTDPRTKAKKTTNRVAKQEVKKSLIELVRKTDEECVKFLAHEGRVFHQHLAIKRLKESLHEGEAVIHCDFSENYATKYHGEIQSVHFGGNRLNLSLHTVVVYYREKDSAQVSLKNFCSISQNLDHSPAAIWAHFTPVFGFLQELEIPISKIHFLSDGPSSQYRNKSLFFFFQHKLHETFAALKEATWNYHESGHGKGAPDGIGATVKRTADRTVAQGKDVVDIDTLVKVLQDTLNKIEIPVIESSAIEAMASLVPSNLKPFKGTMSVHQIAWKEGESKLYMNTLSCFSCSCYCKYYKIGTHDSYHEHSIPQKVPRIRNKANKTTPKTKNCKKMAKTKKNASVSRKVQASQDERSTAQLSGVSNNGVEFPDHLQVEDLDLEKMQWVTDAPDVIAISAERRDFAIFETIGEALVQPEEVKTTNYIAQGLCFKCGGAVSSVKLGVIFDICQRIFHQKCFSIDFAGPTEVDDVGIFCCKTCDEMATTLLDEIK